ncbi:ABC transporter permease [Sinosporangium siamense]|uniref:Transport permease protein n=1 Tax=Sinosporangium siamense TaxID=1367973 RepID=A0A919RIC0_9ACTN|nr:ABC transporter permease [Sinosporangium siamense]GII92379.1 transport permease protein [Sinosporangium siamense]
MNRVMRLGVRRGVAEFATLLRDRKELWGNIGATVLIFAAIVLWIGDGEIGDTGVSVGTYITAGMIAMIVFQVGLVSLPMMIAADKEEGALLRLRTVPGGFAAFLIGRGVSMLLLTAVQVVMVLVLGILLGGASLPSSIAGWLTLLWVLVLGLLAVVPLGAALGALMPSQKSAGAVLALPAMGLMMVSGVFFPVRVLPEAVQWVAQVFPLYWQGHGIRAAILPDAVLSTEIGETWRLFETAGVLGVWLVAGMVLAPRLLRRTTRGAVGTRPSFGS